MPLAIRCHHKRDPLQRGQAIAIDDRQTFAGTIENTEDRNINPVLVSAANLVEHRITLPRNARLHVTNDDQRYKYDHRRKYSLDIEARAARHTYGRNDEDRSRARQPDDAITCM